MRLDRSTAIAAMLFLLAFLAAPLAAQTPKVDQEKITAASDKLDEAVKTKNAPDALAAIDELIGLYIDANAAKDDKAIREVIDGLGKGLHWSGEEPEVITKSAQGLGGMGEDAAKYLGAALKDRRLRKDDTFKPAFLQIVRSLGQTKSERDVKTLTNLLKDKDNDVIVAAADALGNFDSSAKLGIRKMVGEELLKTLDSAYNAAEADQRNTTLQKKYADIGPPLIAALQRVTGASVGTPPEWRKWFNDNKKKKWD